MTIPMPISELLGQRYGRLTILAGAAKANSGQRRVVCRCSCGIEKVVRLDSLHSGRTHSCGCLHKELSTTHGKSRHPLYGTWNTMLHRCTNAKHKEFERYGGRGITVCDRWSESVENYIADITTLGPKPGPEYSVDRVDNNGNYELKNVRWALPVTQNNNQRLRKYAGKQPKGASGVVGVTHQPSGKWKARIQCNGKDITLGTFSTLEEAVAVREGAEAGLDYQRGRAEH